MLLTRRLVLATVLLAGSLGAAPEKAAPPADPTLTIAPGVVAVVRAGRQLALGTVLNGDGRILTALSPLTHGNDLRARYQDGSSSALKLEHFSRAWDMALLTPLEKNTTRGLKAAQRPFASEVAPFTRASLRGARLVLVPATLEPVDAWVGHDSAVLNQALRVSPAVPDAELGAPIVNASGEVIALLGRACAPGVTPCRLTSYGIPVDAVRSFLAGVPRTATLPSPWLGIGVAEGHSELVRGVRVVALDRGGPGELAGLRVEGAGAAADIVVSADGTPVPTPRSFLEEISRHEIGVPLTLLVLRQGKLVPVRLTPAALPAKNPAAWPYRE